MCVRVGSEVFLEGEFVSMRALLFLSLPLLVLLPWGGRAEGARAGRASVTDFGAVGDGRTLNTEHIQSAINQLASKGGGTLVVPRGVFLSGAIFLKPGVNLQLDE